MREPLELYNALYYTEATLQGDILHPNLLSTIMYICSHFYVLRTALAKCFLGLIYSSLVNVLLQAQCIAECREAGTIFPEHVGCIIRLLMLLGQQLAWASSYD